MGTYISFWTIVWWTLAGGVGLVGLLLVVVSFWGDAGKAKEHREMLVSGVIVLAVAGLLFGIGNAAKGSVAAREADRARAAVGRAQQALEDLNYRECGRRVCPNSL